MEKVCVVTIDTRRFFDECQKSYLPIMHKVFGVYIDRDKAQSAIWEYFRDQINFSFHFEFEGAGSERISDFFKKDSQI